MCLLLYVKTNQRGIKKVRIATCKIIKNTEYEFKTDLLRCYNRRQCSMKRIIKRVLTTFVVFAISTNVMRLILATSFFVIQVYNVKISDNQLVIYFMNGIPNQLLLKEQWHRISTCFLIKYILIVAFMKYYFAITKCHTDDVRYAFT